MILNTILIVMTMMIMLVTNNFTMHLWIQVAQNKNMIEHLLNRKMIRDSTLLAKIGNRLTQTMTNSKKNDGK